MRALALDTVRALGSAGLPAPLYSASQQPALASADSFAREAATELLGVVGSVNAQERNG